MALFEHLECPQAAFLTLAQDFSGQGNGFVRHWGLEMGKQRRKRWGKRQVKHILWRLWWWQREEVRVEINMHPAKAQLFKYVVGGFVCLFRLFLWCQGINLRLPESQVSILQPSLALSPAPDLSKILLFELCVMSFIHSFVHLPKLPLPSVRQAAIKQPLPVGILGRQASQLWEFSPLEETKESGDPLDIP